MDAVDIFKELIGQRLAPLIVKYDPYKDVFTTHPYRHIFDDNFEKIFTDVIFDSIIFYAYEKDEIEFIRFSISETSIEDIMYYIKGL